jgi:hypothetical protein
MDIARVNEGERSIEVSESKDHVKDAPSFDDDEDITPDYEDRIRSHFGLESLKSSHGGYGAYSGATEGGEYTDRQREAQAYETEEDSTDDTRSSAEPEHGERAGSVTESSRDIPEYGGAEESSEGGPFISDTGSSSDEATREVPTTRQTEETETFQEGGRTKIRRRVIREEIVEEDEAPDTRS